MFNKGIRELLDKLPDIGDIDPRKIRQLLTDAWIEIDVAKSFDPESWTIKRDELRKLASSLEIHAILASTEVREVKACAFVAAEALNISSQAFQDEPEEQWLLGSTRLFERFEASILYLIAGFDSNAAIAARNIETELSLKNTISSAELDLASTLVSYLRLQPLGISEAQQIPEEDTSGSVAARARATLLQTINSAVYAHLSWLSVKTDTDDSIDLLDRVLRALSPADGNSAYHADIYHLSTLLRAAIQQTRIRALRSLPGPNHSNDIFTSFLKSQAAVRPLVWPAALEYAHTSLPGPSHHAVVNVPTGSGKSSIADLAIAHSLSSGWVLYLAPTNALVGQIKRQIFSTFGTVKGVRLFDFRGGGEYGADPELLPGLTTSSKIIVMTPEKCSVLLRNNRELFADLSLCVIDEAHSLGEQSPRASVLEIVVSELILSSPNSKFILLSALIGNPESLSNWLANSTGKPSQVVSVPWRPTRTLRVLAGFEVSSLEKTAVVAMKELEDLPERRKKKKFSAQISFLASLQGEWQSNSIDDYRTFPTTINSTLEINRQKRIERNGYLNPTTGAVASSLAESGKRTIVFVSRNRHHCFTIANKMPNPTIHNSLTPELLVLLELADLELGVPTAIRDLVKRGIAIHSSAVISEERRVAEIAFSAGTARVLFATGGLGQGLNLPADAVVIAGTEIGHDPNSSASAKRLRARSQFLNAIGRAGRATVSSRSMAVVLPNSPLIISKSKGNANLQSETDFLKFEDASSSIESQLGNLLMRASSNEDIHEQLNSAEETAISLLTHSNLDYTPAEVIRNTFAAYQKNLQSDADVIATSFAQATENILSEHDVPVWTVNAAYRSGMTIDQTAIISKALKFVLHSAPHPTTTSGCIRLLVETLRAIPRESLQLVLPDTPFTSTPVHPLWTSGDENSESWDIFVRSIEYWVQGRSYFDCVWSVSGETFSRTGNRGPQDPLPRAIRFLETGIVHHLSMIAGCLLAIIDLANENDEVEYLLTPASKSALEQLPTQLRFGLDSVVSLEWFRAGMRPRALAKLLENTVGLPDDSDTLTVRSWVSDLLKNDASRLFHYLDPDIRNIVAQLHSIHES